jgi:hypothetical protein
MMSTCVSIWSAMEVLIAQFDAFAYALWEKATAFGGLNPRRDAEGARRSRPPI